MSTEVRAEMVGTVWKVIATEGDSVSAGQVIAILESMKMEILIATEAPGKVVQLHVTEGQVVQQGDLLATIE